MLSSERCSQCTRWQSQCALCAPREIRKKSFNLKSSECSDVFLFLVGNRSATQRKSLCAPLPPTATTTNDNIHINYNERVIFVSLAIALHFVILLLLLPSVFEVFTVRFIVVTCLHCSNGVAFSSSSQSTWSWNSYTLLSDDEIALYAAPARMPIASWTEWMGKNYKINNINMYVCVCGADESASSSVRQQNYTIFLNDDCTMQFPSLHWTLIYAKRFSHSMAACVPNSHI